MGASTMLPAPDLRDPSVDRQHQLLQVLVQYPKSVSDADAGVLAGTPFHSPAHRKVQQAILGAWGTHEEVSARSWIEGVERDAGPEVGGLVSRLSVDPIRAAADPQTGAPDPRFVADLVARIREESLRRRIADATGALQRAEGEHPEQTHAIAVELTRLHQELARLRMGVA